jgi:hypothetical protein
MKNVYGFCPVCGAPGKSRDRTPNGNDRCENGHVYSSSFALPTPELASPAPPKSSPRLRIWKTTVNFRDATEHGVVLPQGARAYSLRENVTNLLVDIWWLIPDPNAPTCTYNVSCVGTGHEFGSEIGEFLGTVRFDWLVLHVFVKSP